MKKLTTSVIALSLAMIITCFCIAPTSVAKADVSIPLQPTINILLMYDESYDDVLQQYGLTHEQIVKRFDEIGRLIRYPYYDTFGISLNFTVSDYSSYLGDEYAMQCPVGNGLRTYVSSIAGDETSGLVRPRVGWLKGGQCTCTPVDDEHNCNYDEPGVGHHNNVFSWLMPMNAYAGSNTNEFNQASVYTAMSICHFDKSLGKHRFYAGCSYLGSHAAVLGGTGQLSESMPNPYQTFNMLSNRTVFWHEFGHNSFLHDGNCSENQPCAMSGGFDSILHANDVWCDNCKAIINFNHLTTNSQNAQ